MARDKFHYEVKEALEKDGWTITEDPFYLKVGRIPIHIDLGAEKLIAAEKGTQKIVIEIKTFSHPSFITALYDAVGKFICYKAALELMNSERILYLAIPEDIFEEYGQEPIAQKVFEQYKFKIILYDSDSKIIQKWIN